MKYLFVLVVLCGAIGLSQQGLTREKLDEMLFNLLIECAAKEGASSSDIAAIAGRNPPASTIQKCVAACIGETIGLIRDRKVDVGMSIEAAKHAFGADDPKVAVTTEAANTCAEVTDDDRCEAAAKIYDCNRAIFMKHGHQFREFM